MQSIMSNIKMFLKRRATYALPAGEAKSQPTGAVLGLVFFAIIMLLRSWTNFSQPGLYAEDSIHYFNFYYGDVRRFQDILQHPNGYYNLFNNLVAWLTAKADVTVAPLIYQSVSSVFSFLAIAAFSFSGIVANRYLLFIAPLLLGLSGMNHLYYYISLTFQMYVAVILLLILMLRRTQFSKAVEVMLFVLMSFLIWSGPYSVLAVPLAFAFLVFFRDRAVASLGLLLVTLAYTLSVTESTIMLENLFNPDILRIWGSTLVTDVFFMGFRDSVNVEKLLVVAFTFAAVFLILRRDRFYLKTALLVLVVIVASFAPLLLSNKILLYQQIYPCHLLIAQFFWLALILFTVDRILLRWPARQNLYGGVFVILAALFIIADNIEHADKRTAKVQEALPRFLAKVKEVEGMNLKAQGQRIIISTGTGIFKAAAIVGDRSKSGKLVDRIHVQ